MRTWKHQKGVTLLELVIGLVLFGIIALGFTKAIIPSLKNMTQRSEAPEEWMHKARSKMEKIIYSCDQGEDASNAICNDNGNVTDCNTLCDKFDLDSNSCETEPDDENATPYCQVTIEGLSGLDQGDMVLRLPREDTDD